MSSSATSTSSRRIMRKESLQGQEHLLPAILSFPEVRVDRNNRAKMERKIVGMLRKVRPDWPREDIILHRIRDGHASLIYGGYAGSKEETILVKVYGVEDRDMSREVLTMRMFAARRFGTRLFATFANGLLYEMSTPGITLNYDLAIDRNIYPIVARRVGEMHREMRAELEPLSGGHTVFDTLRNWLRLVPTHLADPRDHRRMKKELPSKFALERELTELEELLKDESANPVLFCHGDLSPSNIVFDPVRRTTVFSGVEFAGPNFQAFEIAQHFMSLVEADLRKVGMEEYVPAKEFQIRWCQSYLAGFRGVPNNKVPTADVESLYRSVQKFGLVFCLQEIVWSLTRVDKTSIDGFDILEYGVRRFQQYHRNKYNVLAVNI